MGDEAKDGTSGGAKGARKPFSQRGGAIELFGKRALAEQLAMAWGALERSTDDEARELTHGIHAYPARVHPQVARTLLTVCSKPGDTVLDPFVGSGTTLVEALCAGRLGLGSDINPLALRLSWLKTLRLDAAARRQLERTARAVLERARTLLREETVSGTGGRPRGDGIQGAEAQRSALLGRFCAPHVARELGALLEALATTRMAGVAAQDGRLRRILELVLSSLLVKVSLQRSDTQGALVEKALPRGRTLTLFRERAEQLVLALAALETALKARGPEAYAALVSADARRLPFASHSVDLILTSPPYVGTYDYAGLQELRAELFGWKEPLQVARRLEVGSRTGGDDVPALDTWRSTFGASLFEMRRVLKQDGLALVIIGDSIADGRLVRVEEWMGALAAAAGLELRAAASQDRPDTFAEKNPVASRRKAAPVKEPRQEHIIALAPVARRR